MSEPMLASLQSYLRLIPGMGNNVSNQFLRALRDEDVVKASELYHSKAQLRAGLQPNLNLGSEHHDNTYLHYAAHLGLSEMYENLIHEHGKPDMKNAQRRNCLHLICHKPSTGGTTNGCDDVTKCNMLRLTMADGLAGMDLKHLLAEKDEVSYFTVLIANMYTCLVLGREYSSPSCCWGWPQGLCRTIAQL